MEQKLREIRIVVGIFLLLMTAITIFRLPAQLANAGKTSIGPAIAARLDPTLATANTALANLGAASASLKSLVDTVSKDYYDPANPEQGFYWDIENALSTSDATSRKTYDVVSDLDAALRGGKDSAGLDQPGLVPNANALLVTLNGSVAGLSRDMTALTQDAGGVLSPLRAELLEVQNLTNLISAEIMIGGDANKAIANTNLAVARLDNLLGDPSIPAILSSSARTSQSLSETAASLDAVTRPWRKKIGQLQLILKELANFIKLTYPLP